jgi:hypothetical protein
MQRALVIGLASLAVTVTIPAADGQVQLGPETVIPTIGGSVDVVIADVDGDGDLDIVELNDLIEPEGDHGFLHVLRNDGTGHFDAPATIDLGSPRFRLEGAFADLAAGDLDGNGAVDFAYVGSTTPLSIVFNHGDGTFAAPISTGFEVDLGQLMGLVDIGDLNGDGHQDLAFGQPGTLAFNDGLGAFEAELAIVDSNARQLELVELNGDGVLDLAFGFLTHVNDGVGGLTQVGMIPAAGGLDCAFADLDGDGDPDVACTRNFNDNLVRVALNEGNGVFSAPIDIEVAVNPSRIEPANLDGDGNVDLVVTHGLECTGIPPCTQTDFITLLRGRGDGTFDAPRVVAATSSATLAVGDLNGDGLDDVVLGTGNVFDEADGVNIVLNTTPHPPSPADVDADGDVDVDDLLAVILDWACVGSCAGDVDGDGAVDVNDLLLVLLALG